MATEALELLKACHVPFASGKSQELFMAYGEGNEHLRISHMTPRLSSHDFMLGYQLYGADEVQQLLNVYWKKLLRKAGILTDLVAYGPDIDEYLHPDARGNRALWATTVVVRAVDMLLLEVIPRTHLTGSAWRQYRDKAGIVYGRPLSLGLRENDLLERMIITYTDKAPRGQHDRPLSTDDIEALYSDLTPFATTVMSVMAGALEHECRACIPDTKLEIGLTGDGRLCVADQVGTPYTSRIWDVSEVRLEHPGTLPVVHDKDVVRKEMERLGIKNFDPGKPDDVAAVLCLVPTPDFIAHAESLILGAVSLITGMTLGEAQRQILRIP